MEASYIKKVTINHQKLRLFKVSIDNLHCEFFIESFSEGIARIKPYYNTLIRPLLKSIESCFDEDSNFNEQLNLAFNCSDSLERIIFTFNYVTMEATKNNCNADKLLEKYNSNNNMYMQRYSIPPRVI